MQKEVVVLGIEFELKFSAEEETLSLLESNVPGACRHYDMKTSYYDTPEGDLSSRRWTLRRRQENEKSVCTLKFPLKEGRGEFEVECDRIEDALLELCKLSGLEELPLLCEKGLTEVCGAKFHRIAKTFTFEGTTMELALDRGVLLGGGRDLPLHEAELELKEGDPQTVKAYAAILAATYGLTPEKKSKFRRALDLAKGE